MTATEQVENLSRDLEGLREKEAAPGEIIRKVSETLRNLRALTENSDSLFDAASVLAPQLESAELAVEVWEDLHKNFAFVLAVLERIRKVDPAIDTLVEEARTVFRDRVKKSEQEILDWTAKADATLVPNAETVAAIQASMRGEVVSFNSVADLTVDLNAED
jgi:hypothetical protein